MKTYTVIQDGARFLQESHSRESRAGPAPTFIAYQVLGTEFSFGRVPTQRAVAQNIWRDLWSTYGVRRLWEGFKWPDGMVDAGIHRHNNDNRASRPNA